MTRLFITLIERCNYFKDTHKLFDVENETLMEIPENRLSLHNFSFVFNLQ